MKNKNIQKKQILIAFTGSMELGGIERSLLGLLDTINYEEYTVDLFLYGHHGPLFPLINSNVNLLPEVKELAYLRESLLEKVRHGCFYSAILRIRDEIISLLGRKNNNRTWAEVMRRYTPEPKKHYDLAIGFFLPFDYIIEKVEADVKIGWVHTDYSSEKIDFSDLLYYYSKVDKIAAVSEQCKESFIKTLPQSSEKVLVIENVLSKMYVEKQAQEEISDYRFTNSENKKVLLSVGRFCAQKNFDNIPDICRTILRVGCPVKWYLIGLGQEEELIRQKIEETHMQEHVIILGKKENPYPYIKACDLYVQPSRYEGKCVAVREAQMLGKPVVITRYATADSQLEDGIDGVIVPMNNEDCAEGIVSLLRNREKMEQLSQNCRNRDYSNVAEVNKLYSLVEKSKQKAEDI